jgi:hypothetical protein
MSTKPSVVARFMAGESALRLARERCLDNKHIRHAPPYIAPCATCEDAIEAVFRRALGPVPRAKKVRRKR